ncbi:aminotransferase class IV [Algoriphagus chordae]|uniref:branched-chain-amino-acid transaminase n=1 Tax=Algoriphagus chordae TaxID=237019 RepID=A0A2W7R229_9BACT|nr:aminotransferase class IV [Algoriphagus chordae]PZX54838.1 branched-chain amino acid aminotransferase [Algoriphagus chordae]
MNSIMTEIETIYQKSSPSETWFCEDTIKLPNRASSYGDGLFETMVWDQDHIRFFDKHLLRLSGGMELLGLDFSMINSNELISLLASKFPKERKRIRWSVFRAGAGKYTPEESDLIQVLQIAEATLVSPIKKHVAVSKNVQLYPSLWSQFKTLNAMPYILANKEKKERGLDELILLDHRGYISEASIANIFWIKSGEYFTPSLSCGCINGISRQVLIDYLDSKNIPIHIGEFKLEELVNSEQVFVTNSSGVSYLENYQDKKFSIVPIAFLKELFN